MRVTVNGRLHVGSPVDVVREMKSYAFGGDEMTIAQFVERSSAIMVDTDIEVTGSDDDELCKSLINAMVDSGTATTDQE